MLAVILVIVVGTIRLVGSNANNVFSGYRQCAAMIPAWVSSLTRASVGIVKFRDGAVGST